MEEGLNTAGCPEQTDCDDTGNDIAGLSLMVIVVEVLKPGHGDEAAMEYVTVYTPGLLSDGLMAPLFGSMDKVADDVNVPPIVPDKETGCNVLVPVQKGDPA